MIRPLVSLTVLLLAFTGFAAHALTIDPLWYDETRSYYYAGWDVYGPTTLADTLTRVRESDVQAPGYFSLLHLWGRVMGHSAYAARLVSLFAGVLAIAVIYRLGRHLAGEAAGIGAAGTLAASAFFLVYAHEARTYALLVLLMALALWAYWRLLTAKAPGPGLMALFVLSMAALPYSHYLSGLLFPALAVHHLLFVKKNRRWWLLVGLMAAAAALFVPWVVVALSATTARAANTAMSIDTFPVWRQITETLSGYANGEVGLLAVLLLAGFGWKSPARRFVWSLVLLMSVLLALFDAVVPVLVHVRYLLVLWAGLALAVGLGFERLSRYRVAPVILLALWWGVGIGRISSDAYRIEMNGPGSYAPWHMAMDALRPLAEAGDTVLMLLPPDTLLDPYHAPVADIYRDDLPVTPTAVESLQIQPDEAYISIGLRRVDEAKRLWVARDPEHIPARTYLFEAALAERFTLCERVLKTPRLWIDLYAREAEVCHLEDAHTVNTALVRD